MIDGHILHPLSFPSGLSAVITHSLARRVAMETAEPHVASSWMPRVKAEDDGSAVKPKQSSPSWTAAAFSWMVPAKKSDVKREEKAEKKVDITPREFCWLAHNCG